MKNLIKSYVMVFKPTLVVAAILALMVMIGGVGGYGIGRSEVRNDMSILQKIHTEELARLQANHSLSIKNLTEGLLLMSKKDCNKQKDPE